MSARLLVYGSGGHGKVVADAARAAGWDLIGFADDDPARAGQRILGLTVIATGRAAAIEQCKRHGAGMALALGDNAARRQAFRDLHAAGLSLPAIIHPSAVLAPSAVLGPAAVVLAGAIVNPDTRIGANTIINTAASIDHDNTIADHAHVSPGAHTGGTVTMGEGAHIGIGAAIRNNIRIGAWAIIGAGAVVVRNIPDRAVAYGNPARIQGSVP